MELLPSGESHANENLALLFNAAGQGLFAGLLAAGISHWIADEPVPLIMVLVYGLGLYRARGWRELCALLSMIGGVLAYFAVVESVSLGRGIWISIGLSLLAIVGLFAYLPGVVYWTARTRAKALGQRQGIPVETAKALAISGSEQWLEPKFARMRSRHAAGTLSPLMLAGPALVTLAALGLSFWLDGALLVGLASGLFLFGTVVFARTTQYFIRIVRPRAASALARDPRPPILFLRPFRLDELPVDRISDGWRGVLDMFSAEKVTFEERLVGVFSELGPVIAIGRPGEDAPPLGAAREYANEELWQQVVLERAASSQLVIMELDASPGMEWEIENVSKRIGLRRVALVLPPGEDIYLKRGPEWYQRWSSLQERFGFLPDVAEDAVAVIFDRAGDPILVASDQSSIPKRLSAFKAAWLETRS